MAANARKIECLAPYMFQNGIRVIQKPRHSDGANVLSSKKQDTLPICSGPLRVGANLKAAPHRWRNTARLLYDAASCLIICDDSSTPLAQYFSQ